MKAEVETGTKLVADLVVEGRVMKKQIREDTEPQGTHQ
jgi:hypothetical protein